MIKKTVYTILTVILIMSCSQKKGTGSGQLSPEQKLVRMSLDEKVHLLIGTGADSATTYPIERLGIPAIEFAGASAEPGITHNRKSDHKTYNSTVFPTATALASTWNAELIENVGAAMGNEALGYGADVLLAPALNIHRNPLGGRNFDSYSEDPLLSGKMAAAQVRGVQSNGIGASLKYFAAHNQETNRTENDSRLTPRALREIYLKGFEIAVKESEPWTVISSPNYINGVYASESSGLLTTILRDEWGFKGAVMTDWFGGKDAPAQVRAGNDLLMPGNPEQYENIMAAVKNGKLRETAINRNVLNVLRLIQRTPRSKAYNSSNNPDLQAHAQLARQSAAEGMVLLKNNNSVLPLGASIKKIAVYGANAVSLVDGLKSAGYDVDTPLQTINVKNTADVALIAIERTSQTSADRKLPNDFNLASAEKELIQRVCRAYQPAGKKVIVVLNVDGVIETASWKNQPDAILLAWQPGQEGSNAVADILTGKANPSGKLPVTFPVNYMDVASSANFPLDNSQADSGEHKEPVRNVDYTIYAEDIFVGYRYFDTFRKEVSYPFGYGLSYSSFEYSNPAIKDEKNSFVITVDIKNTSEKAGKEVVQLYVSAPLDSELPKPLKELKAFGKTGLLQPGESQTVEMKVNKSDLASFSDLEGAWVVDRGNYRFLIGASSQDIRGMLNAQIGESIVKQVRNVLLPREPLTVLAP